MPILQRIMADPAHPSWRGATLGTSSPLGGGFDWAWRHGLLCMTIVETPPPGHRILLPQDPPATTPPPPPTTTTITTTTTTTTTPGSSSDFFFPFFFSFLPFFFPFFLDPLQYLRKERKCCASGIRAQFAVTASNGRSQEEEGAWGGITPRQPLQPLKRKIQSPVLRPPPQHQ